MLYRFPIDFIFIQVKNYPVRHTRIRGNDEKNRQPNVLNPELNGSGAWEPNKMILRGTVAAATPDLTPE